MLSSAIFAITFAWFRSVIVIDGVLIDEAFARSPFDWVSLVCDCDSLSSEPRFHRVFPRSCVEQYERTAIRFVILFNDN